MIQSGGKNTKSETDKIAIETIPCLCAHTHEHKNTWKKMPERISTVINKRYDCESCTLLHCNSSLCTFIVVLIIFNNFSLTRHDHLSRAFVVATQFFRSYFKRMNATKRYSNWSKFSDENIQTELFSINREIRKRKPTKIATRKTKCSLILMRCHNCNVSGFFCTLFVPFDSSSSLRQFTCSEMIMNARSIIKSK